MNVPHSDALVFFGATGDPAYKKIFPALQAMIKRGRLGVPVIGVARAGWNLEQLRLQSEHINELKIQLEGDQSRMALDLEGVTLADVEVVRFLNACEERGIELFHCSPYIREWISREKAVMRRKGMWNP